MGRARGKLSATTTTTRGASAHVDDGRGLPLTPSNATEEQLHDFSSGFCHMLALELHARHGWQMRGLAPPADKYSMNPWRGLNNIPDHVYCLREDGLPVDVNGVFASEAAIHRFYAHQHNPDEQLLSIDLSLEDFESYLYEHGYRRPYDVEQEFIERHVQNLALDQLP